MPSLSEALEPFSAVIITGGSSGIGKSFIQLGQKLKPSLVICNLSRRPPPKNISEKSELKLNHFACDLSRRAEVARGAAEVEACVRATAPAGPVLLINNSGFGAFGPFAEPSLERELEMIDLNVHAVVQLTGRLLPFLRERGGVVMTIASTVAFQPTPLAATYGATKAFVLNWTIALNEELRGTRVRALAVCPGTTRTDFFHQAGVRGADHAPFAMTSEAVAVIALRALADQRAQVVTGWRNKLMTFFGARLPKPLAARISRAVISRLRAGKGRA